MSLYGAFDQTKHFSELDDPLVTQEGVLTPAQRRARAIENLFGSASEAESLTLEADIDFDGQLTQVLAIDSDTVGLDLDYTSTDTTGNQHGFTHTMNISGAGATGGRALFETNITGALGGWANAVKAITNMGVGGSVSGLGSALVAELVFGPASDTGTYGVLELEMGHPDGSTFGTASFIHAVSYGDTEETAAFDDAGYLLNLQGVTEGDTHLFNAHTLSAVNEVTHGLKVRIGASDYYILLATAANFSD